VDGRLHELDPRLFANNGGGGGGTGGGTKKNINKRRGGGVETGEDWGRTPEGRRWVPQQVNPKP